MKYGKLNKCKGGCLQKYQSLGLVKPDVGYSRFGLDALKLPQQTSLPKEASDCPLGSYFSQTENRCIPFSKIPFTPPRVIDTPEFDAQRKEDAFQIENRKTYLKQNPNIEAYGMLFNDPNYNPYEKYDPNKDYTKTDSVTEDPVEHGGMSLTGHLLNIGNVVARSFAEKARRNRQQRYRDSNIANPYSGILPYNNQQPDRVKYGNVSYQWGGNIEDDDWDPVSFLYDDDKKEAVAQQPSLHTPELYTSLHNLGMPNFSEYNNDVDSYLSDLETWKTNFIHGQKDGSVGKTILNRFKDRNRKIREGSYNPSKDTPVSLPDSFLTNRGVLKLKSGVDATNLIPELRNIVEILSGNFPGLVVTSTNEGKHTAGSTHYDHEGVDIGANSSNTEAYAALKSQLPYLAKQLGFRFIDEGDHIHISKSSKGKLKYGGVSKMGYRDDSPYKYNPSNLINSNHITMDGVSTPLLGISNTGDIKYMPPHSGDYTFQGNSVLEIPLMKNGGIPKYQKAGAVSDLFNTRKLASEIRAAPVSTRIAPVRDLHSPIESVTTTDIEKQNLEKEAVAESKKPLRITSFGSIPLSGNSYEVSKPSEEIVRLTTEASEKYGVPLNLLLAQQNVESNFRPWVVSKRGAVGLTQFIPLTAKAYGVKKDDLSSQINGQAMYLKDLFNMFKDWEKAIMAYNAGPTAVRNGEVYTYKETLDYVDKIKSTLKYFQKGGTLPKYQTGDEVLNSLLNFKLPPPVSESTRIIRPTPTTVGRPKGPTIGPAPIQSDVQKFLNQKKKEAYVNSVPNARITTSGDIERIDHNFDMEGNPITAQGRKMQNNNEMVVNSLFAAGDLMGVGQLGKVGYRAAKNYFKNQEGKILNKLRNENINNELFPSYLATLSEAEKRTLYELPTNMNYKRIVPRILNYFKNQEGKILNKLRNENINNELFPSYLATLSEAEKRTLYALPTNMNYKRIVPRILEDNYLQSWMKISDRENNLAAQELVKRAKRFDDNIFRPMEEGTEPPLSIYRDIDQALTENKFNDVLNRISRTSLNDENSLISYFYFSNRFPSPNMGFLKDRIPLNRYSKYPSTSLRLLVEDLERDRYASSLLNPEQMKKAGLNRFVYDPFPIKPLTGINLRYNEYPALQKDEWFNAKNWKDIGMEFRGIMPQHGLDPTKRSDVLKFINIKNREDIKNFETDYQPITTDIFRNLSSNKYGGTLKSFQDGGIALVRDNINTLQNNGFSSAGTMYDLLREVDPKNVLQNGAIQLDSATGELMRSAYSLGLTPQQIQADSSLRKRLVQGLDSKKQSVFNNQFFDRIYPNYWETLNNIYAKQYPTFSTSTTRLQDGGGIRDFYTGWINSPRYKSMTFKKKKTLIKKDLLK